MAEVLVGLVIVVGLLFLGTYLLNKYGQINNQDVNLLYAGYFSIGVIMKLGTIITSLIFGTITMGALAGAGVGLLISSLFAYYFFNKANVL